MGYYTNFNLEIDGPVDACDKAIADMESAALEAEVKGRPKYGSLEDNLCYLYAVYEGNADSSKWYDHEKDMREISKRHPDVLFTLSGEGEESGDIWKAYHKNGKAQECRAKITFDDYDEIKLI